MFFMKSKKEETPPPVPVTDGGTFAKKKAKSKSICDPLQTTARHDKDVTYWKEQASKERAGKRKLFHSLVKLAGELKKVQKESDPLREHADYANQGWHQGGLWRAPAVLPGVQQHRGTSARLRESISLSDLFFNLVMVTALTRVGEAISNTGSLTVSSLLYFAVFWTIWSKKTSYSTRFDTTDLSAQAETLITCFAVLFGSLSVNGDQEDDSVLFSSIRTEDGTRIMVMAAFCALLHCCLLARVWTWHRSAYDPNTIEYHVRRYAQFIVTMNFVEAITWIVGIIFLPQDSSWRFLIFVLGICFALRIPRAFLASDFHAACTKRGVLFILLLGFVLQTVVVIAGEFFEYRTPTFEEYSFIGASCLLLFCIKLLYVDNESTLALNDHAMLVNQVAAFGFNMGQFVLLLSTTVMGSGLKLLTHSYLAAAAALPDDAKSLVCSGFSAVLFSTLFIKSMHLKRVPINPTQKAMFIGAYCIEAVMTIVIVGVTAAMSMGYGGYLQVLMQSGNEAGELLWVLSGFALILVFLGWLDEGLELALFGGDTTEDGEIKRREYLVHPFGFWWCLKQEVVMDEFPTGGSTPDPNGPIQFTARGLSEFSPLIGESLANMKIESMGSLSEGYVAQRHSIV